MPNIVALKLSASYPMLAGLQEEGSWLALDQLALQQQINANFIFHAISNYKKTPFERKTLDFISKKGCRCRCCGASSGWGISKYGVATRMHAGCSTATSSRSCTSWSVRNIWQLVAVSVATKEICSLAYLVSRISHSVYPVDESGQGKPEKRPYKRRKMPAGKGWANQNKKLIHTCEVLFSENQAFVCGMHWINSSSRDDIRIRQQQFHFHSYSPFNWPTFDNGQSIWLVVIYTLWLIALGQRLSQSLWFAERLHKSCWWRRSEPQAASWIIPEGTFFYQSG